MVTQLVILGSAHYDGEASLLRNVDDAQNRLLSPVVSLGTKNVFELPSRTRSGCRS